MSVLQEGQTGAARQAYSLPMDRIRPNPRQPRQAFDEHALMELASSIRQHGLLQPITVRSSGDGYELIMGERRLRACRMLGFTAIDAFILPATADESAELALIENLQRESLHYFEEAEAYAELIARGMTQDALAHRLGKSAASVANKLRLLKLEPELRQYLWEEGLSERHARALLPIGDGMIRQRIARQAAQRHLTVRETEALVARHQSRLPQPPPRRKVISVARDHRLYVNALRGIVLQMQETGLDADYQADENDGWLEIHIRMKKTVDQ